MPQQHSIFARRSLAKSRPDGMRAQRPEGAERVAGAHLDLRLGGRMTLRPIFDQLAYEGTVVGFVPYRYFMVQCQPPLEVLQRLHESPALAVRASLGGSLYVFHTDMLSRVGTPASVLFLSHPQTVDRMLLRRSRRVRVSLPCSVHGPFGDHEGMVVDMDNSGCRFNVRSHLSSPLRRAEPGQRVVLNCRLWRSDAPLSAPLLLKRVEEAQGRVTMGGQFVGLDQEERTQLEDYVQRVRSLGEE